MSGNCDLDVDECGSQPCQNGAVCIESTVNHTVSLHSYNCLCASGFANGTCAYDFLSLSIDECTIDEGGNCDIDVDECASNPCQNGATCTESSVDPTISSWAYQCTCVAGYTSGKCDYDFISEYTSECSLLESSSAADGAGNCEIDVDECASSPCQNNATCSESVLDVSIPLHAYRCACTAGFANGACGYDFIAEYTVECMVNHSTESAMGGNCDMDVDECVSSPCTNGAICSDSGGNWSAADAVLYDSFRCSCTDGYASGVCDYDFIAEYAALCNVTEGGICDVDVDECASGPCENAATCTDSSGGDNVSVAAYRCTCTPGHANGLCLYDHVGHYEVECNIMESDGGAMSGNCD
jgi:hypothetical protein